MVSSCVYKRELLVVSGGITNLGVVLSLEDVKIMGEEVWMRLQDTESSLQSALQAAIASTCLSKSSLTIQVRFDQQSVC